MQKFGREFVDEQGLLPWRVQEFYGELQRAFESLKRPNPPAYVLDNIVFYSAILAHYVADGHVPLHAVVNYDGQLTEPARAALPLGERAVRAQPAHGSHSRRSRGAPVTQPRDFMFDVLLASNRLAAGVLEADQKAADGPRVLRRRLLRGVRGTRAARARAADERVHRRVAAVITGAWEQAGRPARSRRTAAELHAESVVHSR